MATKRAQRPRPKTGRPAGGSAAQRSGASAAARARSAKAAPAAIDQPVDSSDFGIAVIVGLVAAAIFASTFSSNVAMGDAPEAVSGVRSLGILHAPGYPMYVLAARGFGSVVAIGSWATRTNLFSLVCAALTIGCMFVTARLFGARPAGAAIASLALAVTASFWFDADFAKHYAFSSFLLAAGLLAALWWQHGGAGAWLVASGALLATGGGAAWQLAGIMLLGVVLLVALGPRRPSLALSMITVGTFVGVLVLVGVYVITRAGAHPAVDWGGATDLSRLAALVRQSDFQNQAGAATGGFLSAPKRAATYIFVVARDTGIVIMIFAVIGGVAARTRLRRDQWVFLAVLLVGNLVAVATSTGISTADGFFTGLVTGGFVLDLLFVVVILGALGIDASADLLARTLFQPERPRRGRPQGAIRSDARTAILFVLGAIVLLPPLVVHYHVADHRGPALADRYGTSVLDALPAGAVLVGGGYEYVEPVLYRQIVHGQRPDVTVVSADLLALPWYREQVERALGPSWRPPAHATNSDTAIDLARTINKDRPVYLDTYAMQGLGSRIGYVADGLVGRVVDGTGPQRSADSRAASAALAAEDQAGGLDGTAHLQFPNYLLYYFHERAHIELAKQYALSNDTSGAINELRSALSIEPDDGVARGVYNLLLRKDPRAPGFLQSM
jgi:hypothetical protein